MTRVKDFYAAEKEFYEVLEAAEENATSSEEMRFVDDISNRVSSYGMEAFISERQNDWLRKIAEVD